MSEGYKIVIHTDACLNRFAPKFQKAQKFLDNEVLKDSAPYVPMRTGHLMKSGVLGTVLGSGEVVYNAPYARRCYYGAHLNFRKDKHPQATAFWFEKAKSVHLDKWVDSVNKILDGG